MGNCYTCGKFGHSSSNCPSNTWGANGVDEEEDDAGADEEASVVECGGVSVWEIGAVEAVSSTEAPPA